MAHHFYIIIQVDRENECLCKDLMYLLSNPYVGYINLDISLQ